MARLPAQFVGDREDAIAGRVGHPGPAVQRERHRALRDACMVGHVDDRRPSPAFARSPALERLSPFIEGIKRLSSREVVRWSVVCCSSDRLFVLLVPRGRRARRAADQHGASGLPGRRRSCPRRRPATPLSAPEPLGVLWTYADRNADGAVPARRRRCVRRRDEHLRPGRLQCRRHRPRRRRLRAPLASDRLGRRPRARLSRSCAASRTCSRPGRTGNVVLWMQPDGTLNPSADPAEPPDPPTATRPTGSRAPSGRSARATARSGATTRVRRLPGRRLDLALRRAGSRGAVAVSAHPGRRRARRAGLADRRRRRRDRRGDARPRRLRDAPTSAAAGALARFAEGVAALQLGGQRPGPTGRCFRGRCRARSGTPGRRRCRPRWPGRGVALGATAACVDAARVARRRARFTPHLLVAGGPENGWIPRRRRHQIAYGADARLEKLLAVAAAAHRPGLRRLAGVAGSWYFGNNPAGAAMYDPATG